MKIASSTTSGTGPFAGKLGYALYNSNTRFVMVAPSFDGPTITEQPVSQTGTPGAPLVLSVGIDQGSFPFTGFQWCKNGVEIPGQKGNSLYIPSFNPDLHSGRYQVKFSTIAFGVDDQSKIAKVGHFVEALFIIKTKISTQQSATFFQADTSAGFDARVEGFNIIGTFPVSSITVRKPNNSTVALTYDDDHWDAETYFPNYAALQTAFPDGNYSINIGTASETINSGAGTYPNQPLVTSSTGTWASGKLRITAAQAAAGFTLTTNHSTGTGWVKMNLADSHDDDISNVITHTTPDEPDFAVITVLPGQLSADQTYQLGVEFENSYDAGDSGAYSWAAPVSKKYSIRTNSTVLQIEVVPDSIAAYTTWQTSFFNPTQLANPAISGDDVDFDNDGIPNLLEYLFGGNPILPNSGILPTLSTTPISGGRNLIFSYKRKLAAAGVTQVIESSSTLSTVWTPAIHGQNGVTITTTPVDAQTEQVTATIPMAGGKGFVRMRASR